MKTALVFAIIIFAMSQLAAQASLQSTAILATTFAQLKENGIVAQGCTILGHQVSDNDILFSMQSSATSTNTFHRVVINNTKTGEVLVSNSFSLHDWAMPSATMSSTTTALELTTATLTREVIEIEPLPYGETDDISVASLYQ